VSFLGNKIMESEVVTEEWFSTTVYLCPIYTHEGYRSTKRAGLYMKQELLQASIQAPHSDL
jgi:hypothetical protein